MYLLYKIYVIEMLIFLFLIRITENEFILPQSFCWLIVLPNKFASMYAYICVVVFVIVFSTLCIPVSMYLFCCSFLILYIICVYTFIDVVILNLYIVSMCSCILISSPNFESLMYILYVLTLNSAYNYFSIHSIHLGSSLDCQHLRSLFSIGFSLLSFIRIVSWFLFLIKHFFFLAVIMEFVMMILGFRICA